MQNARTLRVPRRSIPLLVPILALFLISVIVGAIIIFFAEKMPLEKNFARIGILAIKEVSVTSEWPLTPSQVKVWLPPLEGKNILLVSPDNILQTLKQRPWVDSVLVRKQYPDRLFIEVTTKRPRAVAVHQGQMHWIDVDGRMIEKATPELLRSLELPVITKIMSVPPWNYRFAIDVIDKVSKQVAGIGEVSQVFLGSYPLFKVYLSSPRVEILFSSENWETQVPLLVPLLKNPPPEIGQPRKISLVFPKKAVVSPLLSH